MPTERENKEELVQRVLGQSESIKSIACKHIRMSMFNVMYSSLLCNVEILFLPGGYAKSLKKKLDLSTKSDIHVITCSVYSCYDDAEDLKLYLQEMRIHLWPQSRYLRR